MNLLPRFSRLMAEALHCAATPAGLALSLGEVHDRLKALADEERALPLPSAAAPAPAAPGELPLPDEEGGPDDALRQWRLACDNARFAVYAWVDEQMLQSPRLDAADWLGYSLQYHYFATTDAGQAFFSRLTALVRSALPAADAGQPGEGDGLPDGGPQMLEAFVLHGADERTTAVAEAYALCLLYGFRGMLHDNPDALARYRKAAYALLCRKEVPAAPGLPRQRSAAPLIAAMLERAAYALVPLLVVLLFGTLCAAELADMALPKF